jgi:ubiquitin carboxyl-terminal hydrolase 8
MPKGQIGLQNLGNTCYLNAVLQCIRHVPDLSVFMNKNSDSWIHSEDSKEVRLCKAYKTLVCDLWSGTPPSYLRPEGFLFHFKKALEGTMFDHMIEHRQHDAHEALVFIIDQLHEAMIKPLKINVMAPEGSAIYGALTAWKDRVAQKYSPIVDYFWGLMQVNVTCQGCKNVSCRYEEFAELQVEFPDKKAATLEECMDHQFKGEQIDEYQCDKCSPDPPKDSDSPKPKRHPAVIHRRIWKLPLNLILVLKRFNANGTKCNANFSSEPVQKFEKWFADGSPEVSKKSDYAVHSIVNHHGFAGGGHYNAQIKSPETGMWNVYDDESVGQYGEGKEPVFGVMNYILFFRKT